jgi:hypothetical protein
LSYEATKLLGLARTTMLFRISERVRAAGFLVEEELDKIIVEEMKLYEET